LAKLSSNVGAAANVLETHRTQRKSPATNTYLKEESRRFMR
jgi:hypothetical protein